MYQEKKINTVLNVTINMLIIGWSISAM